MLVIDIVVVLLGGNLSLPSPEWKKHGPGRCNPNAAQGTGVTGV